MAQEDQELETPFASFAREALEPKLGFSKAKAFRLKVRAVHLAFMCLIAS